MKAEQEIREEIARQKKILGKDANEKPSQQQVWATLIIDALEWVLGESDGRN